MEAIDPAMLEAMHWIARMRAKSVTLADKANLDAWREAAPEHDQAYEMVMAFEKAAALMPAPPAVISFCRPSRPSRRMFLAGAGALAASVAGFMVVRPPLGLWPSLAELMSDHRTEPGEQYAFAPSSGIHVLLNTKTSVSLEGNGVRLIDGEAFIQVADRDTPYRVQTSAGNVQTKDAKFNVRNINGQMAVACISGQISCTSSGQVVPAQAGDQVISVGNGLERTKVDVAAAVAWREGMLVFHGTPLSTVIAEINRYRPGRIVLANSAIGDRPVIGIFHTAHIENTVNQIRQLLAVPMTKLPGGVVLIG
jgi:transmembrane sensor